MSTSKGWIAVDLDGTLAFYDHWRGIEHIGEPIPLMLERVKGWLAEGKDVRIFTARVHRDENQHERDVEAVRQHIDEWCVKHLGRVLPVTNTKDFGMIELWDDRCVQVEPNTGVSIKETAGELAAVAAHIGRILEVGSESQVKLDRLCELLRGGTKLTPTPSKAKDGV